MELKRNTKQDQKVIGFLNVIAKAKETICIVVPNVDANMVVKNMTNQTSAQTVAQT